MQIGKVLATFCVVAAVFCLHSKASASECDQELAAHLKTDLSLGIKEFDQSQSMGWRVLEQKKCYSEAAKLIYEYEQKNNARTAFLEWHRAQLLAMAGDYNAARPIALTTIRPEPGKYPAGFQWNDYVLAVISFWDGDRASFENHLNQVKRASAEADDLVKSLNASNSKVLDRLDKCFGRPYADALDCE